MIELVTLLWLPLTVVGVIFAVLAVRALPRRRARAPFTPGVPVIERECDVYVIPAWPRWGDRPAYVGEGYDWTVRYERHRDGDRREPPAWWWPLVDTTRLPTVERHPSKLAAKARESELIDQLAPLGNKAENRGRHRAAERYLGVTG